MKRQKLCNLMYMSLGIFLKNSIRITNHIQHLKNSDYIIYKPPTGLQKGINKEVWETKAIVLNNRTTTARYK